MEERRRLSGRSRLVTALIVGAVIAGMPYIELWLKCHQPESEACVWGRSYLPLSVTIGVMLALVAVVIVYFVLGVFSFRAE